MCQVYNLGSIWDYVFWKDKYIDTKKWNSIEMMEDKKNISENVCLFFFKEDNLNQVLNNLMHKSMSK